MTTLTVSLPDAMRAFVEQQARESGYATPGDYLAALVADAQRQAERRRLEAQLVAGLDSGHPIEVNDAYWAEKQARLLRQPN